MIETLSYILESCNQMSIYIYITLLIFFSMIYIHHLYLYIYIVLYNPSSDIQETLMEACPPAGQSMLKSLVIKRVFNLS